MVERDLRYQQRFEASQEALHEALVSINLRLAALNELRQGVATSGELQALEKVVNALTTRIQVLETTRVAGSAQLRSIYAAIAAAVGLISVIVLFSNGVF